MCGQGGAAGTLDYKSEKFLEEILIYNSTRGQDSTGAASVKRPLDKGDIEIVIAKELGHPFNLIDLRRSKEHDFSDVKAGTHRVLMGHCRSSTKGEISRRNAHPFSFETVLGTHNGTLDYQAIARLERGKSFQTDSEALFHDIECHGVEKTIPKLDGAWALVWYDVKNNSINFLRNKERPFAFAFTKDRTSMYWSSESRHLAAAMNNPQNVIEHDDKFVYFPEENMHYMWELPEINKPFGKAHIVKREGYKHVPFSNSKGSWNKQSQTFEFEGDPPSWKQIQERANSQIGNNSNNTDMGCSASGIKLDEPWEDLAYSHFWMKLYKDVETHTNRYTYGRSKDGPWFTDQQKCWDSLPDEDQKFRMQHGKYSKQITTGWIWDASEGNTGDFVKVTYELSRLPGLSKLGPSVPLQAKPQESPKTADELTKGGALQRYKEARFQESIPKSYSDTAVHIFSDDNRRVYYDKVVKKFAQWNYQAFNGKPKWTPMFLGHCPEFVPFTDHDVAARHQWTTVGRKKNKVRAFKGFKRELIVQKSFETKMQAGCLCCQRHPRWGNDVTFISSTDFFCEYCRLNTDLVSSLKENKSAA